MSKNPFELTNESWTIWKYSIPLTEKAGLFGDCFTIEMPKGAQVISLATQGEASLVMWAIVEKSRDLEERHFLLCGTGRLMMKHPSMLEFVGTTMLHNGYMTFHVFEVEGDY